MKILQTPVSAMYISTLNAHPNGSERSSAPVEIYILAAIHRPHVNDWTLVIADRPNPEEHAISTLCVKRELDSGELVAYQPDDFRSTHKWSVKALSVEPGSAGTINRCRIYRASDVELAEYSDKLIEELIR